MTSIPRIGFGVDAHRFAPDRRLVLGGVEIPHCEGLLGHSDADVLVHAVMDALLGAVAAGDIGHLFPDTDPKWKGADSIRLLEAVVRLLREKGFAPYNIDATVMAEAPKLAPHIHAMRARIAGAVSLDPAFVSVKATTVETMGAIGRREGIAACAVASVMAVG